ncbi:MAG: ATP-binding protein [bacterium]
MFSLWTLSTLIEWTNIHIEFIMFVWSFGSIILGLIAILSIYFIYVFLEKKTFPLRTKLVLISLVAPVILLSPTSLHLTGFDITTCDAFNFEWLPFKIYYVSLGVMAMIWIFVLLARKYRTATADFKKQIILMGMGMEFFLSLFFLWTSYTYYLTQIGASSDSQLEMYGLLGMVIFLIYIGILMVRFKTFNVRLLGAQALMWTIGLLVGSAFFFVNVDVSNRTMYILISVTLAIVVVAGYTLVKSVKKLDQQKSHIEHLLKIKSEFIDVVSHQLRTPVSVIKGMASMLKDGDLDDMPKDQVDIFKAGIYEKSVKLSDILNDMLRSAEVDMDNFQFTPERLKVLNISQIVKNSCNDLITLANEKKLDFKCSVPVDVENLNVQTDDMFIGQSLKNFIDNAIKYSNESGFVHVELEKDGKFVIIKIIDNGIGIPPEEAHKLFEKFVRASNAVNTHAYGTGLGLFFAKKIVDAHTGGKVWFESELNKGTTFFIKLPISNLPVTTSNNLVKSGLSLV